jgi:hypothetical protein
MLTVVADTTAATLAVATMVGAAATTGVAGFVATPVTVVMATAVMVTDLGGDSALAWAGGGHTGIHTATATALGTPPTITLTMTPTMGLTVTQTTPAAAMILPRLIADPTRAVTPR